MLAEKGVKLRLHKKKRCRYITAVTLRCPACLDEVAAAGKS